MESTPRLRGGAAPPLKRGVEVGREGGDSGDRNFLSKMCFSPTCILTHMSNPNDPPASICLPKRVYSEDVRYLPVRVPGHQPYTSTSQHFICLTHRLTNVHILGLHVINGQITISLLFHCYSTAICGVYLNFTALYLPNSQTNGCSHLRAARN